MKFLKLLTKLISHRKCWPDEREYSLMAVLRAVFSVKQQKYEIIYVDDLII